MSCTLLACVNNAPITVVLRISPLHRAKKIIIAMKLAMPSDIGTETMQTP